MENKNFLSAYLLNKNCSRFICLLLSLFFIFPKILLVEYSNDVLWSNFDYLESLNIILQDFILAIFYYLALRWAYNKNKPDILVYAFVISSLLLASLLMDVRVRELWLRPINIDLIQYAINNYKDLMSGSDVFLKYYAGFGMTFRRIAFLVASLFLLLFLVLFYLQKVEIKSAQKHMAMGKPNFKAMAAIAAIVAALFVFTVNNKSLAYNTQANLIVNPLVKLFEKQPQPTKKLENISFEQPLISLEQPLGSLEHSLSSLRSQNYLAEDTRANKPFKNVIILILESIRFKEFASINASTSSNFHMPFLKKIASEGLLRKCYVSVPHTSKSQFAILSGRNPLADIEMRESMIGKVPSIVSLLKETKGSSSHFITVQNLNFENTSGMLKALGFEHLVGPSELSNYGNAVKSSSFGLLDETLLNYPYDQIKAKEPFILAFMTMAAHYPYLYPNKTNKADTSYEAYLKAAKAADNTLALVFDKLGQSNLLDDTLVVIVGDHGESFGEHGTYIHNSSMFEEEVTVPLIFWSADGRLKNTQLREQARQIDIAPTIAEFLGVVENKNYTLQGTSLIKRSQLEPPIFISTFFSKVSQAIVHNQTKTILNNADGKVTQYDLQNDPAELNGTVIKGAEYEQFMDRFKQYTSYHEHVFKAVH